MPLRAVILVNSSIIHDPPGLDPLLQSLFLPPSSPAYPRGLDNRKHFTTTFGGSIFTVDQRQALIIVSKNHHIRGSNDGLVGSKLNNRRRLCF